MKSRLGCLLGLSQTLNQMTSLLAGSEGIDNKHHRLYSRKHVNIPIRKLVQSKHERCAQRQPTHEEIAESDENLRRWTTTLDVSEKVEQIKIETYFHVVQSSAGTGGLTSSQISESMLVINAAFAPNFIFKLVDTDRVSNSIWHSALNGSQEESDMKRALRRGSCAALNIYSIGSQQALGWAAFPRTCSSNQNDDGVVILFETAPQGNAAPYNEGDTLTHEIGHWLGLFHTFEGGCERGDFITDTPAEDTPAFGCPLGRDTCTGPGLDPIKNYMDFTDDSCMEEFTANQVARMQASWEIYRAGSGILPTSTPAASPTIFPTTFMIDFPSSSPSISQMSPPTSSPTTDSPKNPSSTPTSIPSHYPSLLVTYPTPVPNICPSGLEVVPGSSCRFNIDCPSLSCQIYDRVCCRTISGCPAEEPTLGVPCSSVETCSYGLTCSAGECDPIVTCECSVQGTYQCSFPKSKSNSFPEIESDEEAISTGMTSSEALAMPSICNQCESEISIYIIFDKNPIETQWKLINQCTDEVLASGGPYSINDRTFEVQKCLPSASYIWRIFSPNGQDVGKYSLTYNRKIVGVSNEFARSSSVSFGGKCGESSELCQ